MPEEIVSVISKKAEHCPWQRIPSILSSWDKQPFQVSLPQDVVMSSGFETFSKKALDKSMVGKSY